MEPKSGRVFVFIVQGDEVCPPDGEEPNVNTPGKQFGLFAVIGSQPTEQVQILPPSWEGHAATFPKPAVASSIIGRKQSIFVSQRPHSTKRNRTSLLELPMSLGEMWTCIPFTVLHRSTRVVLGMDPKNNHGDPNETLPAASSRQELLLPPVPKQEFSRRRMLPYERINVVASICRHTDIEEAPAANVLRRQTRRLKDEIVKYVDDSFGDDAIEPMRMEGPVEHERIESAIDHTLASDTITLESAMNIAA